MACMSASVLRLKAVHLWAGTPRKVKPGCIKSSRCSTLIKLNFRIASLSFAVSSYVSSRYEQIFAWRSSRRLKWNSIPTSFCCERGSGGCDVQDWREDVATKWVSGISRGEMIETGGSLQPDANQVSAFHKTALWLPLWELLHSMVLTEKRAFLVTGSESDPCPFSSFKGPVSPSFHLAYLHNFRTILVVWPAVHNVPVGTPM